MAHSPKRGKAPPKDGSRSPTGHRTKAQMSSHWQEYGSKHKSENRKRVAARAKLEKSGAVKKGDGKDVHHKKGVRSGGSNSRSNLKVTSRSSNRGKRA